MMPTTTLTSGLVVANFSSPHSFRFTDGSELGPCSPDRANLSKLDTEEVEICRGRWTDIRLTFILNPTVRAMLSEAYLQWRTREVDVVIVPLPVITAMRGNGDLLGWDPEDPEAHPFRTIRSADRVSKVNYADRFCV